MEEIIADAPVMIDFLDDQSAEHFEKLKSLLDGQGIQYVVNPRLVRGLDYYNQTVFEWVTDALGSQGTVCGGGRYDSLVEKLGGRSTPAIGWAMGVERLIELYEFCGGEASKQNIDVYIVAAGHEAIAAGLSVAEELRQQIPGVIIELNLGGGSYKTQLKRADKSGAAYAVIQGEAEIERQEASLKPLRTGEGQSRVAVEKLTDVLAKQLKR